MFIGSVSIWNKQAFQRKSRQLDQLSRGDYTPIAEEIAATYPNTDLAVRAIPFVERYCAELTGLYLRPVVRRFGPVGLATADWQRLQGVYAASKTDPALGVAEVDLWLQNVALVAVLPSGPGQVNYLSIKPWQVDAIELGDPLTAADPSTWVSFKAQVPAQFTSNNVVFGTLELTRTHAWRYIGGQRVGLYSRDGSHPFGRVPLAVACRVAPDSGRPLPSVNEAVLNLQVALSLQQADNELIVRHCAWPQKVIENADVGQLVESITIGPDKISMLVRSGDPQAPAPTLRVVQGQVPVSELVAFAEHQIRLYCAMLGLDPSAFLRVNTAVTAAARLFSSQDRKANRDKLLPVLADLETQLLWLVPRVVALRGPAFPVGLTVGVEYQQNDPSPDPQSAAQALTAEAAIGLTSPVREVAARDGIGLTEARRVVEQNLADSRALGIIPQGTQTATVDPATSTADLTATTAAP